MSAKAVRRVTRSAVGNITIVLPALLGLLLVGCSGAFRPQILGRPSSSIPLECIRPEVDSSQRTAVVVHGDLLGFNYATEFLKGCSPACFSGGGDDPYCRIRPHLNIPTDWQATQLHTDRNIPNYRKFYLDARSMPNDGADDTAQGLEQAHLVFYAGHGAITELSAWMGHRLELGGTSVGDLEARYFWMISCNVMAHGPLVEGDYTHPWEFDPDIAPAQKNVFLRWGRAYDEAGLRTPLNPRLRMACGGSSVIGGSEDDFPTDRVWQDKLIYDFPVSDSFLHGLAVRGQVPLCITRGGEDPEATPLLTDRDFDSSVNACGDPDGDCDYIYIQYPVPCKVSEETSRAVFGDFAGSAMLTEEAVRTSDEPPAETPVLVLEPVPLPPVLESMGREDGLRRLGFGFVGGSAEEIFGESSPWLESSNVEPRDVLLRYHPGNGAIIVSWSPQRDAPESAGAAGEDPGRVLRAWRQKLVPWIDSLNAVEPLLSEDGTVTVRPGYFGWDAMQMRIDRAPAQKVVTETLECKDVECFQTCLYARMQGAMMVNDVAIPLLGEGGEWTFRYCPGQGNPPLGHCDRGRTCAGEMTDCPTAGHPELDLSLVSKRPFAMEMVPLKSIAEARTEARRQLREEGLRGIYDLEEARIGWGYRVAPLHCRQERMYLVYQFHLQPRRPRFADHPPVTIEVLAHRIDGTLEDSWTCDPRTPTGVE